MMVAALYVETAGAYFGLPGIDPWDEPRDARKYAGPHPVVAHPPCQRWGRFWHGSTRKPHQFKLGDDGGCFASALDALERFGGVLEHPCDSHAWAAFGLNRPPRHGGWVEAGRPGMWTCCVYQGHYGHMAGKPTWLLAKADRAALPELRWGKVEQRLHPVALARHGYAKARRIGMMAMIGGKDKTRLRNATPPEFRELLVALALSAARKVDAPDPDAWYCEQHPERLMGHDGCPGAGIQESCRIHMLLNKVRLAEQETRETAMVRDDLAAQLRRITPGVRVGAGQGVAAQTPTGKDQ